MSDSADKPSTAGGETQKRSKLVSIFGVLLLLVPVGLVFFVVYLLGGQRGEAIGQSDGSLVRVNTMVARSDSGIENVRSFPGEVRARRSGDLGFEQGGRIVQLLVREGDQVQLGQALAELDKRRLQLSRASLDDALQTADDKLQELDPAAPEMTTEQVQIRLSEMRSEIGQLEAEIIARSRDVTGQPTVDQAFADRLTLLERQIAILALPSRSKQIDELTRQVNDLQDQITQLDLQIEAATLVAPYDGTISIRHAHEGQVVSAGMPVVRLVESAVLETRVPIPVELAAGISVGTQLTLRANNHSWQALVMAKQPELDRTTRTRTVLLQWDASVADQVIPGEVVNVELTTKMPLDGIWVPFSALRRESDGLWSVFIVIQNGGEQFVDRRYVELLHLEEDRALVGGNLVEGDWVIANGGHRVVPGQQVIAEDSSGLLESGRAGG